MDKIATLQLYLFKNNYDWYICGFYLFIIKMLFFIFVKTLQENNEI